MLWIKAISRKLLQANLYGQGAEISDKLYAYEKGQLRHVKKEIHFIAG